MSQTQKSETMKVNGYTHTAGVPEEVCLDVQAADIQFASMRDIICSLIETHAKDIHETITSSAIFKSYLKMAADAKYEWEQSKRAMLYTMFPDGQDLITDWSLDYTTCVLSWNEVPAGTIKPIEKKSIEISKDVVSGVQEKHALVDCLETIIRYLAEVHASDVVDVITPSDAFKNLQKLLTDAKMDFEHAKQGMLNTTFGEEISTVTNWSLDYSSCILTYSK